MVIVEVLCLLLKLVCCCTPVDCFYQRGELVFRLSLPLRCVRRITVSFECEVIMSFLIRRHPLVLLCHCVLHIFDGALAACVIIDELVFFHEERGRSLGRVYVPI